MRHTMKKTINNPKKLFTLFTCCIVSFSISLQSGNGSEPQKKGAKPPTNSDYSEPELPLNNNPNPTSNNLSQGTPIIIPFGLKWGESPETVRKWSKEKGYNRRKYEDNEKLILEVEGPFENLEFQTVRFHYVSNTLIEIELQYPPKSSESEGLFQLGKIKGEIEKYREKGQLEPQIDGHENSSFWRINRYTWNDSNNFLWLVNFQMKETSPSKIISITSLHYRKLEKK